MTPVMFALAATVLAAAVVVRAFPSEYFRYQARSGGVTRLDEAQVSAVKRACGWVAALSTAAIAAGAVTALLGFLS